MSRTLKVTCLSCMGSNKVYINETAPGQANNQYIIDLNTDHKKNPKNVFIISGRFRSDLEFGWECVCGNTSIVSKLEKDSLNELVIKGNPQSINRIAESLKIPDEMKFETVELL